MKKKFQRIMGLMLSAVMVTASVPNFQMTVEAASTQEHIDLTRQAAAEGMVLMENDVVDQESGKKALPLAEGETVAMFGRAMIDYVTGGGGSGSTNVDYTRNILQGMQIKESEDKISLVPELVNFYTEQVTTNGITNDANITIPEDVWNAAANATETAIVTIGRYSSEGSDRSATKGDYYLSDAEEELIEKVAAEFDKTIVVLNVGAVLDTSWIKGDSAIQGIDAVLMAWQAGMEGGLATADVLVGDVNPSGKLVDTFAKDYTDYPSSSTFNESNSYVNYEEDIYVGYRYFETIPGASEKVNYEFGYGLSYTDFTTVIDKVQVVDDEIEVTATVTNIGDVAGKQVVQVYFGAPRGDLGKPAKELAAFDKTDLIEPGKSETLVMSFPITDMSSYDDTGIIQKSAYVMEAGEYNIYVGNSIKDAGQRGSQFVYTVQEDTVTEQLTELCAPTQLTRRLQEDGTYADGVTSDEFDPHYTISAEGKTKVEMENYIDGSSALTIESFYDAEFNRKSCLAYLNTAGYYVEYELTAETAGRYSVIMSMANGNAALENCFTVTVNGEPQTGICFDAPQTGDGSGASEWYNFVECEPFYINLNEGKNIVRFTANRNNPNYDYMILERVGEYDNSYDRKISASGENIIEAESFDESGVKTGNTSNAPVVETAPDGTKALAYMNHRGNYVKYYMYVEEAGTYEMVFCAANGRADFTFDPGVRVGTWANPVKITAKQTGDGDGASEWYNFEELDAFKIQLPQGNCVLQLTALAASYPNVDYIKLTKTGEPENTYKAVSASEKTRVEAEEYDEVDWPLANYPVIIEDFNIGNGTESCVAYMNHPGNNVSYHLNAEEAGEYDITMYVSNGYDPYEFKPEVTVNDVAYPVDITVDTTSIEGNRWYNFVELDPITVTLEEGNNILTFKCTEQDQFPNFDYFVIEKKEEVSVPVSLASVTPNLTTTSAETGKKIMLLDVYNNPDLMDEFLAQISDEQLIAMLGGQPSRDGGNTGGMGNLMEFGIPNIMTADGPQGIRISTTCTAWPISTLLACTWDVDLVEKVGKAAAEEAHDNNMDIWLAPGMNIHRDPLCGRNFEYYSEDPLLAGKLAAAITKGCQSEGVAISLKHFAANNKETNRSSSDSRLSERALREIYLKGFEIAVKEADPWTIMSSYNYINGIETSENKELLTGIARGEWGYEGLFETDWGNNSNHARELLAGNDVKMPTGNPTVLATALANGTITRDHLLASAERLMNLIMKVNYFQEKIVNPPIVEIGADTKLKAAENIIWSETVNSETTSDSDGGKNLGYCDAGAWAQYEINVLETGDYNLTARCASNAGSGEFDIVVDGETIAHYDVPRTGAWQNWTTLEAQIVKLEAGRHTLRVEFTESGSNLNWLHFELIEKEVLAIVTQPENSSACEGETVSVSVEATGEGLTYAWYYKNPGNRKFYVSSDQFVSEDGTTYSISMQKWRDGQEVYCVVTDKTGAEVQSDTVVLTMSEGPIVITKQPENVVVETKDDLAKVSVEATGEDLTYTWYYKNPGNKKFYVSGEAFAEGNTYTIAVSKWRNGQQVYCVITDANGNTVKSDTVTLSIQQ